jgi:hypothetical protein
MVENVASEIALSAHRGQRTRSGDPVVKHLARVAAAVAPEAQATAWLHDLLELTPAQPGHLRARGLTVVEGLALDLLTRDPNEPYEDYVLRLARAPGAAGRLARQVKLADLEDHLAHPIPPGAPPYEWARRCVSEHIERETSTAMG